MIQYEPGDKIGSQVLFTDTQRESLETRTVYMGVITVGIRMREKKVTFLEFSQLVVKSQDVSRSSKTVVVNTT